MSTSSYPLYMTGNEVAEALRKIVNEELVSSGITSIPSTEMDRFDPATLHTPGLYTVDYITGNVPVEATSTHPIVLRVTTYEDDSGVQTITQTMSVGSTTYTCQSINDGATWTEWAVSGAGGSFGDAAELTAAETHAIIDPILDGEEDSPSEDP